MKANNFDFLRDATMATAQVMQTLDNEYVLCNRLSDEFITENNIREYELVYTVPMGSMRDLVYPEIFVVANEDEGCFWVYQHDRLDFRYGAEA